MRRPTLSLFITLLFTLAFAGMAFANIPDPGLSDVPNVVMSPAASIAYTVTVIGSQGPVDGATVDIVVSAGADALVCWCTGQVHPTISAVTDPAGEATFFIAGGGCLDPVAYGGTVAEVYASGILLAAVGIVSPDAVDAAGILPTGGWNPGGSCSVGLSDATRHTTPIATGNYDFCSDIDSDLSITLSDAVILTSPIKLGETCTEAP